MLYRNVVTGLIIEPGTPDAEQAMAMSDRYVPYVGASECVSEAPAQEQVQKPKRPTKRAK